jgi:biotin carboxylase
MFVIVVDADPGWIPTINKARERGCRVVNLTSEHLDRVYPEIIKLVDDYVVCDTSSVSELRSRFELFSSLGKVALLTTNDGVLEAVAKAASQASIPFTSSSGVELARNKGRMRKHLECAGFPMPAYSFTTEIGELVNVVRSVGYPCVLKPASGHSSWFCSQLQSDDDLAVAIASLEFMQENLQDENRWALKNGFLCEEWLEGPVVSVPVFATYGKIKGLCLAVGTTPDYAPCAGFGSVIPYQEAQEVKDVCIRYAEAIVRCLGLDMGVFDIEMVWTIKGPVLIEVNARRMGGVLPIAYELATGENFSDYILDTYLGIFPSFLPNAGTGKTAVIRKLISAKSGSLKPVVPDERWLNMNFQGIYFQNYELRSSQKVEEGDVLARIIVLGDFPQEAFYELDKVVAAIEEAAGHPLMRGKYTNLNTEICKCIALAFMEEASSSGFIHL